MNDTYMCLIAQAVPAVNGGLCDSNDSHASVLVTSRRSGVPLGAEAVCGGGGWTLAQEQPTDNRQQCPGGILRGGLLLCTLGEFNVCVFPT